jgi:hypothetical protein
VQISVAAVELFLMQIFPQISKIGDVSIETPVAI